MSRMHFALLSFALVPACVAGAADEPEREAEAAVDPGTWYVFEVKHSGKALDVSAASNADGANVQQWTKNGTAAQDWQLQPTGDGYYVIRARCSGKSLDVQDRATGEGANVQQWGYGGGWNQQWRLEDAGGGYYYVRARHSGRYLDVAWASKNDGANVAQVNFYGSDAQKWKLVPHTPASTPPPATPPPATTPPPSSDWKLVWSDEFDGSGLPDDSKWGYDVGGSGWGNGEAQYYTDHRTENARQEGGRLIVQARRESYGGNGYTSARLLSKQSWLYGKMETRAKLPAARGTWPAIWMLPTDWKYGGWPNSGELDIMEHVGWDPGQIHGSVHTQSYNHTIGTQKTSTITVNDYASSYHVYGLEWTPEKVDVYVDGTHYFAFTNEHAGSAKWPFDQRFHMILNVAVGGSWGGVKGIDEGAFPQAMEVDWVRVYQK